MLFTMEKERLGAFMDAVLAIIMTILVLDLKELRTFDLQGLWELRESFFAYTLSFFWLGTMWINLHREYSAVEKISQKPSGRLFLSSFSPRSFPMRHV
ncbi:MAG: TMEM175 family protein [Streptococcus hyointestinalis]|nr:TMEM175 family protein [Streptococcus hyointestinalis]MDD6383809.1 TMEM175 family protein [Streptococcus hyointestinalis]